MFSPASAQIGQKVGEVVRVVEQAWGTPAGGQRTELAVTDPVSLEMEIETGPDSLARMTFDPRGTLELGPEMRLVIDQDRVDRLTGRRQSFLSLLLGRLRLAIDPRADREVEIQTPTTVIGVRGTVVIVDVAPDGSTTVAVLEGRVTVRSLAGGPALELPALFRTLVQPGGRPSLPAPIDPRDWTLTLPPRGRPPYPAVPTTGPNDDIIDRRPSLPPP